MKEGEKKGGKENEGYGRKDGRIGKEGKGKRREEGWGRTEGRIWRERRKEGGKMNLEGVKMKKERRKEV